jgi:RNA polymerase sigma factor for flagellar operon FliA
MPGKQECVRTQKLIEDHIHLVYRLARQISRRLPLRYDFDDLVGYGMVGLVQAAQKFQAGRGVEFVTFAYPRINGAIFDGVSSLSWMSRAQFKRYVRQRQEAEAEADTSRQNNASNANLRVAAGSISPTPLSTADTEAEISGSEETPAAIVSNREMVEILGVLVASLPPRQRLLITAIYIDGMTLQNAADKLGISKGWASRLHASTLAELAKMMEQRIG